MTPSGRRHRHALADLERDLTADPAIRGLAELFPAPPDLRETPGRPNRRHLVEYLVAVAVALGGLVCCVIAAPADQPILTVAGAVLAVGAATFLVVIPRGQATRDAHFPVDAGRR